MPATRKLFALRSEAIAFDTICSAGRAAISLPVELELERLELGAPLDPVPLLALEQPARITPAAAIAAGADYLVVGRPITRAADPLQALELIDAEIAGRMRAP